MTQRSTPAAPTAAPSRAQVFAVANQKGGVGKTTTSVNLAAAMAALGYRALLVDLDPQGNATMHAGIDKMALDATVYHMLVGLKGFRDVCQRSPAGFDVLPANRELAGAELELVDFEDREHRLRQVLNAEAANYDLVVMDCPPSLSMLTLNGLCAADGVIIPMQCEYFALEGLTDLVNSIGRIHAGLNKGLRIIGLLRVMFDTRMTLSLQVSEQLDAHFGDKVFQTVIPRNVRLAEAPSHGMPVLQYDAGSRGAQAYKRFAAELCQRLGLKPTPQLQAQAAAPLVDAD